ncbi:MAG: EAL domain-containing protein [Marinobacter sp.]|uniref:putative bifunctional diguanylate cyclase/phosphodiesterase n=1 Tax=Marinobacter sp. TaxID=50741 RepID=UPI00299E79AE|nr:EAL domain-containing protein [Marinobacter sp.]MDX1755694.1 EAL domain-containing protein [Marinobacter sp.]
MPDVEDEELVQFADDDDFSAASTAEDAPWRILIVDDEEQVHQATRYALKDTLILGQPLHFVSVYSAAEARQVLADEAGFAVILLDVVMESPDAGLGLVSFVRDTCNDPCARIILRTGQPGYVPELEVIQKYDINDYKSKEELTRVRLVTTVTAAVRAFQQLQTIEASRRGLTEIVSAANQLFKERGLRTFSQGVVMQLCALLHIREEGFACCHFEGADINTLNVLAGGGQYAAGMDLDLDESGDDPLIQHIREAYRAKQSKILPDRVVLHVMSPQGDELVIHVQTRKPLNDIDQQLLELFSVNIAVGFDNARMFEHIERLAYTDTLTGLPNHASLSDALGVRLKKEAPCILVLTDLDNFQGINDGLGRQVGDSVLREVAGRLRQEFEDGGGLVARVAADSFAVLIPSDDRTAAERRLQRLIKRFERNLEIAGNEIPVSLTAGLAIAPEHGKRAEALLRNAGIALKQAKRTQRSSYCTFDPSYEAALKHRLHIGRELRHCVEQNELRLYFQPQISLRRQRVIGAEALVRWHKHNRVLAPSEFVPVAEDSGHIIAIGAWVLEEACRTQVAWREQLDQDMVMAVNVSMRQLTDPDFFSVLDDVLARTGIAPQQLELEVTETMMMTDAETLKEILSLVRERGIKVAIDDFGTGYSSLGYLQQLPVDRLKIDRSFVQGLDERSESQVIAALVVEMGHQLKLEVIAEGVETESELALLRRLGCDDAQGNLYAEPLAKDEVVTFVQQFGQVW